MILIETVLGNVGDSAWEARLSGADIDLIEIDQWEAQKSRFRKTTTKGAFIGGLLGLIAAVVMVVLSKTVWVDILGNASPLFPYNNPALFSMVIAFVGIWVFSLLDRSQTAQAEERAFEAQYIRSQTGLGAEGAAAH